MIKKTELNTKTFDAIFKKIEELDKVQRLAICIITIGLLGAAFYFLMAAPKIESIQKLKAAYEQADKKLGVAKKKAAQLEQLQNERKMKEAEFRKVMKALPENKEIPSLLTSISQSGQDTGMEFQSFTPGKENNKGFYGEIPVDMEMVGSFHNTVLFFDRVTSLNRIVNIRDIDMNADPGKDGAQTRIKTKCQAVTYKFVEQADVPQNAKKGKKKR
ncbi:type 4a pilus biogenesis protein PilO [Desulfatiferula olefinivorans]